jgi:hypothetical protein
VSFPDCHPREGGDPSAAARLKRSRTPSHSGASGGICTQISDTAMASSSRSTANSCGTVVPRLCPNQIKNGWIGKEQLLIQAEHYGNNEYGQYLRKLTLGPLDKII